MAVGQDLNGGGAGPQWRWRHMRRRGGHAM
jgi:hypothetical protein